MIQTLIPLLLLAITFNNAIASSVDETTISKVLVGSQFGNQVILSLSKRPTNTPSCQTNSGYDYVFDATTEVGKTTLSVVLTAYASKSEVKIGGGSECTLYSNIENLVYIETK